jgi:alkanesulfonate monooxygenase SsuD/methylene tetrahydromethanopterin reductase-like flavin-dependent oxidoreductase (luciferase family)
MTTLGVVFRPQSPPEELRAVVEAVDASTVDELWLWEDCFLEGGLTTAAAALAWSTRVRVGIGLLPVPFRNPALAAMELATLARLFPGRVVVALGHGVQSWMQQVGAAVESPLTLLREHTVAVRDLLAGQTVDLRGRYVHLDAVTLDWPPAQPPTLLLGARGPKTISLAGEIADGVLLDSVTDPDVVRRARDLVGDRQVSVYAPIEPGTSADDVHATVAGLASAGADAVIVQGSGEQPDPRPFLEALAAAGSA